VDLQSDERFCGNCLTQCAAGATCNAGQCECPAGWIVCAGTCVNPQSDPKNCNGCDTQCDQCIGGVCTQCTDAALVVLQDLSGSMSSTSGMIPAVSRLSAAQQGIGTFVNAASGFAMGLRYFPLNDTPACTTAADCGPGGSCNTGATPATCWESCWGRTTRRSTCRSRIFPAWRRPSPAR
jgi:hypothetical protein